MIEKINSYVDNFLNKITMYRLVLYILTVYVLTAIGLSIFQVIPHSTLDILYTLAALIFFCGIVNFAFAATLKIPTNVESFYITAFILALIITPAKPGTSIFFLFVVSFVAMASKYVLAYKGKLFFNPAALAVVITFFTIEQGASWWVGNAYMLPAVLIGGFLILRKIQRFDFVTSFLLTSVVMLTASNWTNAWSVLESYFIYGPILFFTSVMLTEPSTSPPNRKLRILEGVLVGLLFYPGIYIGNYTVTPEIALLVGNIFAFIVSPKGRFILKLDSRQTIAKETYEFVFESNRRIDFQPGQYLEYTIPQKGMDARGNRRYFTVASSPTEDKIRLGIKFYEQPSTFKKYLTSLDSGQKIFAGQLAGDFTLPEEKSEKLAFIAGGIGITPFRSMIKYLMDKNEERDIVLFYLCKTESDVAYKEILEEARQIGVKTVYVIGATLNAEKINIEAPDIIDRTIFISGPHGMVEAFKKTLQDMGVSKNRIKIDFFPGYA